MKYRWQDFLLSGFVTVATMETAYRIFGERLSNPTGTTGWLVAAGIFVSFFVLALAVVVALQLWLRRDGR